MSGRSPGTTGRWRLNVQTSRLTTLSTTCRAQATTVSLRPSRPSAGTYALGDSLIADWRAQTCLHSAYTNTAVRCAAVSAVCKLLISRKDLVAGTGFEPVTFRL